MSESFSGEIRIPPDVMFRELVDEAVILDLKSQRYYGLDLVGTRMWQLLAEHGRVDEVVRAMLDEFDVEEEQLREDVSTFLSKLEEQGLVELSGSPSCAGSSGCGPGHRFSA